MSDLPYNNKGALAKLKCASNLHVMYIHLKGDDFFALMLMFLTKFVQISTIRSCSSGINFINYDANFSPNIMHICIKYNAYLHQI